MAIELRPHIGINVIGEVQDVGQWMIYDDDRLIGFLNYQPNSEVQPVYQFPYERTDEIVAACVSERERLGNPSAVKPPQLTLKAVEDLLRLKMELADDDS